MITRESLKKRSIEKALPIKSVQYPFIVRMMGEKTVLEYYQTDQASFHNERPEVSVLFRETLAQAIAHLILNPHIRISAKEWSAETQLSLPSLEVMKSRFKKKISPEAQQFFPPVVGHIFVPPGGVLEKQKLQKPQFFTAHGFEFAISENSQIICFHEDGIQEETFDAENAYRAENAEYVLLRPNAGALLYLLAENFDEEISYLEVVKMLHMIQGDIPSPELLKSYLYNVRTLISLVRKCLPKQLAIDTRREKGVRLLAS